MSLGSMLAEANIGKMARQGERAQAQRDRIIAQNDRIIALLTQLVEQRPEGDAPPDVIRTWTGPVREVGG